jgi:HEAT repeat protein
VLLTGCATSGAAGAALHGDLENLRREIASAQASGALDRTEVIALAQAVARRELKSALGDLAVERVRQVRTCVRPLQSDLEELSEGDGAGAAAAMLALVEAGRADNEALLESYLAAPDPNWRAVAARAATGPAESSVRRQLLTDGDLRVRRAALHATLVSPDPSEFPELVEAARLDPDPLVRSLAVQALGQLGGSSAVASLRDLWPRADNATRQAIVSAWAAPHSLQAGGEAQLQWVLEQGSGLPAVVAASHLSANPQASAFLVRSITQGPVDEQRLAIQLVRESRGPLMEAIAQQLTAASGASDETRLMAAARLVRPLAADSDPARVRLRALAKDLLIKMAGDRDELSAHQARAALIAASERAVVPTLRKTLGSASSAARAQAAEGLYHFGEYSLAATALGDRVGSVRTNLACAILSQR